ncbi:MAG: hypothetical protein CVV41_14545 [Candidatus Riflebacteria bacterium HGW-Riflebacteria-1]|jgi:hypothetical protein|nr:MAG: hypothetical protein CVV41_14545 [Candidatus Riflebacteria bacterium HGW-Riflebacteria-1]
MNTGNEQSGSDRAVQQIIEQVKVYLTDAEIRFHDIADDAVELYMQGHNLTMHVVIYVHNSHLIFRVPGFIRNVDMRRPDVMQFLMQVMSDILDIRFELGKDGNSLSACCQHILEDASITRRQFDLAIMVLIHIVDDTYPHLMKLIYQTDSLQTPENSETQNDFTSEPADNQSVDGDENEESDEFAPIVSDEETRKIN